MRLDRLEDRLGLTEESNLILRRRAETHQVEHLPLPALPPPIPPQEAFRHIELLSERLQPRAVRDVRHIPREDQNLESRIRGKHIMELDGLQARRAHEDMWEHALSDDEVGRDTLMCVIDDQGGSVTDRHARRKAAGRLERTVGRYIRIRNTITGRSCGEKACTQGTVRELHRFGAHRYEACR